MSQTTLTFSPQFMALILQLTSVLVLTVSAATAVRFFRWNRQWHKANVSIYIEQQMERPGNWYLTVSNVGKITAHDLQFTVSPDVKLPGGIGKAEGCMLSSYAMMRGLRYLPPGAERRTLLIKKNLQEIPKDQRITTITIAYRDRFKRAFTYEYIIDLNEIEDIHIA